MNKIIKIGYLPPGENKKNDNIHGTYWVYDTKGICPTIMSRDYKDPKRIMVERNE